MIVCMSDTNLRDAALARHLRPAWRAVGALLVLAGALVIALHSASSERDGSDVVASEATYDLGGYPLRPVARPATMPNLVLIVLDTLRRDTAIERGSMPFYASLAANGVSFDDASASAPWTMPSMSSLLSGLRPAVHGLEDWRTPVPPNLNATTFAEVLSRTYGYRTSAFTPVWWMSGPTSLLQGFDDVHHEFTLQKSREMLQPWLRDRDPNRPFFLFLHSVDVHDPYGAANHAWPVRPVTLSAEGKDWLDAAHSSWEKTRAYFLDGGVRAAMFDRDGQFYLTEVTSYLTNGYARNPQPQLLRELRDAYEGGARWADEGLRTCVDCLKEAGVLQNTLLVVASDHGEAFAEHGGFGHGRLLYDELLRVPLVMSGPPPFDHPRRVRGGMGLVDVLPTFFDLAKLTPIQGTDGRSALPLVNGTSQGWPVRAEEFLNAANTGGEDEGIRLSVRTARWKYVLTRHRDTDQYDEELYDLTADPGERRPMPLSSDPQCFDNEFCRAVQEVQRRATTILWPDMTTMFRANVVSEPPEGPDDPAPTLWPAQVSARAFRPVRSDASVR
jgi:arylsulfatase A-like enzyme